MNGEPEKQKSRDRSLSFTQRAEQLLTKRNQGILFLFTLVLSAAAIFDAICDFLPGPISIVLYVLAAAGLVMTCTLRVKAILNFVTSVLLPFAGKYRIADTLIKDSRLRTVLTALPGMGLNLIYAVLNGVIGITARSAWYGSLSAYYLLLCSMRFLSVSYARQIYTKKDPDDNLERRELKVYRNCGIMLSVSSLALGGAVIMLVMGDGGKSYSGLMIYAAATYTFYKLTTAIINKVKVRKEKSLLLKTLRDIRYSDALVSLFSLQTALLAAFGQNAGDFVPAMNATTGAVVCLLILGLGLSMVYDAKKLQNLAQTGTETE